MNQSGEKRGIEAERWECQK